MEEKHPGDLRPARPEQVDDAFGWETYEDDLMLSASGLSIDQFPTAPLPPIDQWPTQPMPVLVDEPFSFQQGGFVDNKSIEETEAFLQPAIERIAGTGPLPAVQQATGANNYILLARNMVKSSGIYALAAIGSPLVSLVLAPFITHHLSPTDYGILAVLTTVIGLTAGITQLGLGSAFFRAYNYEYTEQDDRRAVLATTTALLFLVSVVTAIIASLIASTLARVLIDSPSLGGLIIMTAWIVVVQNLTVPGFAWLRAENRPLFFSLLSMSNVIMVLVVNLVLLGLLHWGVAGSLLATGSGYAVVALCTLPGILWRVRFSVRRDVAWSLLTFGVPQVFSYVSYWVLQVSDRYLLSLFVSLAQTASYAVAYSLGSVLSTLVISPFSLAWPAMMYSVAKRKDAPHVFQIVFRWFSMVLLFVAFAISIGGSVLLNGLFPASYHSAAPIIPVVAESIVFYGLYIVFMTGASVQRKTWMPAVFSGLAALVNFGLNLVLIPRYGSGGAAASTLIAYIVLALVAYVANQRIYPIPYEVKRFLLAVLIGVTLYIFATVLSLGWPIFWRLSLTVACLILYGVCLLFLGGGIGLLHTQGARLMKRISSDRRVS
jgi:O-antigen/teichoic acid export membrane protein